jgi:hypothetical protein
LLRGATGECFSERTSAGVTGADENYIHAVMPSVRE